MKYGLPKRSIVSGRNEEGPAFVFISRVIQSIMGCPQRVFGRMLLFSARLQPARLTECGERSKSSDWSGFDVWSFRFSVNFLVEVLVAVSVKSSDDVSAGVSVTCLVAVSVTFSVIFLAKLCNGAEAGV